MRPPATSRSRRARTSPRARPRSRPASGSSRRDWSMVDASVGGGRELEVGTSASANPGSAVELLDLEDVATAEAQPEAAKVIQGRSPWRLAFERLRKDRAAVVSMVFIVVIGVLAMIAPVFASLTGRGLNQQLQHGLNLYGAPAAPGNGFLLGADNLGRDVLVRIVYG